MRIPKNEKNKAGNKKNSENKEGKMRIDKFLKVSRILKRRATAVEAAQGGRIKINGNSVKPSYQVKIGDTVEIGFNSGTVKFTILDIKETVKKEQAELLYRIEE